MTHATRHIAPPKNVCWCDCAECTAGTDDNPVCICPDCDRAACGLHDQGAEAGR